MNWKLIYNIIPTHKMGWYLAELDPDLKRALDYYDIHSGSFLDIGTGAGTQAVELAKRGFVVTGTDVSGAATKKASGSSNRVCFLQDDILDTKLTNTYDNVFDRGCFHILNEKQRSKYLETIASLVKSSGDGFYFLKCLSDKQSKINLGPFRTPENTGPYRFSKNMIEDFFEKYFHILCIHDTVYQGVRAESPKALFAVMKRKSEKFNLKQVTIN